MKDKIKFESSGKIKNKTNSMTEALKTIARHSDVINWTGTKMTTFTKLLDKRILFVLTGVLFSIHKYLPSSEIEQQLISVIADIDK